MSAPLHHRSALAIAAAVRSGEIAAAEVARHFLDRVARLDGGLHAFLAVDPDVTLAHAALVDAAVAAGRDPGPLAGVPVAIKDNLCVRGFPATCASRMLADWRPPYDADAVARLLAAGAVPLGKTNLDEFGMGASTEHGAFGPTRNPWDVSRVPGGSSGGSAAAVAAGLAALALGSDTGGSVRQPAALCGVVGAIGTYGRVSRRGLVAFASSLDRVGPIARTAADAATCLAAMCGGVGGGDGDATTLRRPAGDWVAAAAAGVAGLRIGVLRGTTGVDDDVQRVCDEAVLRLRDAGATTADVVLPHLDDAVAVYHLVAAGEASSNLARFDGVRYGQRGGDAEDADDAASMTAAVRARGFGPEVKRRIVLGTFALSAGWSDRLFDRAARVRRLVADDFAAAFAACDVVVCPTSPTAAFPLGAKVGDPLAMALCDALATPASLAGLPALSVPAGRTPRGLPVGLQVIAPALREDRMFAVAGALEASLGAPPLPEAFR